VTLAVVPSPSSGTGLEPVVRAEVLGSILPRLWTRPLVVGPAGPCGCGCALTPETSYGFDLVEFADETLGMPLDPWQRWAAIHLGELLPDGRPRFRKALLIVARQNGKSHLGVVLTLFWQFIECQPLILGTNSKIEYAREAWQKAVAIAKRIPELRELLPKTRAAGIRNTNGEQEMATADGCRYKISAANQEGGRSLTINRVLMDELRQHHTYDSWSAVVPATNAVPDAQVVAITNMGTSRSVVLNDQRKAALAVIESGQGDQRLGLFEWSSPPKPALLDPAALAAANPNVGRRIEMQSLLDDWATAVTAGGEALQTFLTEVLCIEADNDDDVPVTKEGWAACLDGSLTLDALRSRVVVALDVSPDGKHVSLVAAAQDDEGLVLVDVVKAWSGDRATDEARADLPGLVARVKAKKRFYFPAGPAAQLKPDLEALKFEALGSADSVAACMGLAELVRAGRLRHGGDPLLDDHVTCTKKWPSGDGWRFVRKGAGHCDAAYAAAGAVLKARKPVSRHGVHWL
jgi:hypothetical protein